MANVSNVLTGIVRGKTIELAEEPGLPDGMEVAVILQPTPTAEPAQHMEQAFASWAGEGPELDEYLAWTREHRQIGRAPIEP